ncbi:nicotinate-nucleotide diphosphorylase (carboxylating) [Methylophaga sp. 41_12_T18]|nr:nicotinate-nucleotide diphosphorylase (carboxylating) [Methylophaga sp. 41_12_T18]
MTIESSVPANVLETQVKLALEEDIGQQDLTADLISVNSKAIASIITRQDATLCGQAWVNEVFTQLDPTVKIHWNFNDGQRIKADQVICQLEGSARSLLTGERTAMNFLQTLSATASHAQLYADAVEGLAVQILDTRKTIPGFRLAQKYAVRCGGCHNHRVGLYDGILIKENHINAAGSIAKAVQQAKSLHPDVMVQVEVENFAELDQALATQADIVMLDNFNVADLIKAVGLNQTVTLLEASGGITLKNVRTMAETGVDRISIGAITKDIQAIDLSMRFL